MKILIIDNYDSFTYNLVREIEGELRVVRNDDFQLDEVIHYDAVVLSPGPGIPEEAGLMPALLNLYANRIPILGICLGHQAIGEHFGAKLKNLDQVMHGVSTEVQIVNDPIGMFDQLDKRLEVGRYHSWVIEENSLPDCLEVMAVDAKGQIMAMRHREYPVVGLQFHPESILTPDGPRILQNFFKFLAHDIAKPESLKTSIP